MRTNILTLALLSALPLAGGCAAYKLEPPTGFVEVSGGDWETRMKAQDNVGLRVHRFENFRGGTLDFWASDLVTKLGRRGYSLVNQAPITAKNGREGTRFDFDYTPPGTDKPKFYSVALFVTDKWKFTLELAGNAELGKSYQPRLPEIARELKVRGCKAGSKICGGPQPAQLKSPPPDPALAPPAEPTPPAG